MSKITVCGLVNLETTVPVDNFPIEYNPINYKFFGVTTHPSGVGLNLSSALVALGDDVKLLSLCGNDTAGKAVRGFLESNSISDSFVLSDAKATAQSVVLYDNEGKRSIYCDLTDMQENSYDLNAFENASKNSDIVVLCNINFARHLIPKAKEMGHIIATDVHCLWDVHDEYNKDFIKAADILFLSNESFVNKEEDFVNNLKTVTNAEVIVVGMGKKGALLYQRQSDSFKTFPAVYTRPVVNTVGAGDSLFASFLHFYSKTKDAEYSLRLATIFASYKIGDTSACRGFMSEAELLNLSKSIGD
ncbi:MAG: carbohydrate kinase family protein [Ruminococcus sp.]|nr:carbohydrate kinase family protein [Ruminococcus sp.]